MRSLALTALALVFVWVDDSGLTHLTDDPAGVPKEIIAGGVGDVELLRSLWDDGFRGPVPETPHGSSGSREDRTLRILRAAVGDLRRGEAARATSALRSLARTEPSRAEPHWYLAGIERQRGRYERAEHHLRAFLSRAGPELGDWRAKAEDRLAALADEKRLADESRERVLSLQAIESENFRVELDAELTEVSSGYAATALGYLEEARSDVSAEIGVTPAEPLGVVFYGKAAYLSAHGHRFSFQTVGFFDGRIHVAAPAHPSPALRSLLFHEYTHAVFRSQAGGDRPYWLNEGLAELVERRSRSQPVSTRGERASLRARIAAGSWIPLRTLAPSFAGLTDEDARAAYLQAIVAVAWIEERTEPATRARLLGRLGEGFSTDQALHEAMGLDTDGLDAAVRAEILAEFPSLEASGAAGLSQRPRPAVDTPPAGAR